MKKLMHLILLAAFTAGCATSERVTDGDPERPEIPVSDMTEELEEDFRSDELDEFEMLLYRHRSTLTDAFAGIDIEIPEIYLREAVTDEREIDEYAGYRVQIISTRDVAEADDTRDEFISWADSNIEGYQVDAYVIYRQPNYRVRAGNFRNRDMAIEFARLIKNRYPEAWVVHDRIDPDRLPDENAGIKFKDSGAVLETIDSDINR